MQLEFDANKHRLDTTNAEPPYPKMSESEELALARDIIRNMMYEYLGYTASKPLKPEMTNLLFWADRLGCYYGEFTGSGSQLREDWRLHRKTSPNVCPRLPDFPL